MSVAYTEIALDAADAASTIFEHVRDQVANMGYGVRAENNIDVIKVLQKAFAIPLRDASTHGDNPSAARRRREALAGRALAVKTGISCLPHAACHEDDDVRILGTRDLKRAEGVEQPADALGIMKVHLTSERADEIGLQQARSMHSLPDSKVVIGEIKRITGAVDEMEWTYTESRIAVRLSPLMRISEKTGAQEMSNPVGMRNPRAIAIALMA